MKLSMKGRNIFSFLSVFLVFTIAMTGSTYLYNSLISQQEQMIKIDLKLKSKLLGLQVATLEQNSYAIQYTTNKDESMYEFFEAIAEENSKKLNDFSKLDVQYKSEMKWPELIKNYSNYVQYVKDLHSKVKAGTSPSFDSSNSDTFIFAIAELSDLIDKKIELKSLEISEYKQNVFYSVLALGVFSLFLIIFFQRFLARSIDFIIEITSRLKVSAEQNNKISISVSAASEKVSTSVTQQASAIQETSASLEQIKQMVMQSVNNANNTLSNSKNSIDIAIKGKKVVEQMIAAMDKIETSNSKINNEFERSNAEINKIVDMIKTISDKTSVINDIVFQTKLLSFNASVEAARAGEHGKGFAVVAEEIGNLAQMSGKAAEEIEGLLKESVEQVERTVSSSTGAIDGLIKDSSSNVKEGVSVANECEVILENIVSDAQGASDMVKKISVASAEQADGLENITQAMTELDSATHSNSVVATETSTYSADLNSQTQDLNNYVKDLENILFGGEAPKQQKDLINSHTSSVNNIKENNNTSKGNIDDEWEDISA